jgi:hypothetical protein
MEYSEMRPIERLAVAQALYKRLGEVVSTSKADNLRSEVDDYYKRRYVEDGTRTADVLIGGTKVGTFSVIAKDVGGGATVYVEDGEVFDDWVRDDDAAANACIEWMLSDARRRDAFLRYFVEVTGVVPDGCEAYANKPRTELSTRFSRLDPDKVAEALGADLPPAVVGLLGGGA